MKYFVTATRADAAGYAAIDLPFDDLGGALKWVDDYAMRPTTDQSSLRWTVETAPPAAEPGIYSMSIDQPAAGRERAFFDRRTECLNGVTSVIIWREDLKEADEARSRATAYRRDGRS